MRIREFKKDKCKNYPFFCLDCASYCDKSDLVIDTGISIIDTKSPFNHSFGLRHKVILLE